MQLLRQYYINYDLWDMTGDMHRPSTQVMETGLKYYIGAVAGHKHCVTDPAASSLWFRADSANIAAATTMPLLPAKQAKETSGRTGQTIGQPVICRQNIGIRLFMFKTSDIGRYTQIGRTLIFKVCSKTDG